MKAPGGQSSIVSMGSGPHPNTQSKMVLNIHDVMSWREKQKIWDQLGSNSKTEINAKVYIETNVIEQIELPLKAFLSKPSIVVEDTIDFEMV